jgi:excisionase family DNA binding protein
MAGLDAKAELMAEGLDRIGEAARFLKLSTSTIYALVERGTLPSVKIGKAWRIPHRAVIELAAKCLVSGPND